MTTPNSMIVLDRNGMRGTVSAEQFYYGATAVTVVLPDAQTILIPLHLLVKTETDTYYFPYSLSAFHQANSQPTPAHSLDERRQAVVPVIEEDVAVGKRWFETGRVRVHKVVRQEEQTVEETLLKEEVQVQRVPVNRVLDAPADTRYDGDTLIIPIMEERLVVEKRLVLTEEIHVTRRQQEVLAAQTVTVHKEDVIIERLQPEQLTD